MIKITEQHKQACRNLKSLKDWGIIEELLEAYLDSLKDITILNDQEKEEDKNIVVLARTKSYESLRNFLRLVGLLSGPTQKIEKEDIFE